MNRGVTSIFFFLAAFGVTGCSGVWENQNSYTGSGYAARRPPAASENDGALARDATQKRAAATLFSLPNSDGQMEAVRGPAVLFFFTSWCGFCKEVLPEFNQLAGRVRSQGWRVYGIMVGEGLAQAGGYVNQYRPNFPVLLDQQNSVARRYGVRGYPTFVIVSENGAVQYNANEIPRKF